jgi:hypothetical protein
LDKHKILPALWPKGHLIARDLALFPAYYDLGHGPTFQTSSRAFEEAEVLHYPVVRIQHKSLNLDQFLGLDLEVPFDHHLA